MNATMNLGYRQHDLLSEVEEGRPLRIALDATSWVEHISHWYSDDGKLMSDLLETPGWEQRNRWMYNKTVIEPRLTAGYTMADVPVPQVRVIGSLLSNQFGVPYDSVWMNLYRDQNDSTSWHADRPCLRSECIVPVLSLGSARRFLIRHKVGGRSIPFIVKDGDLIVMGGRCQKDWVHCVPKEKIQSEARVSINFASTLQALPNRRD
jgi:alkylated DNA repair dioxygenase AlkB